MNCPRAPKKKNPIIKIDINSPLNIKWRDDLQKRFQKNMNKKSNKTPKRVIHK